MKVPKTEKLNLLRSEDTIERLAIETSGSRTNRIPVFQMISHTILVGSDDLKRTQSDSVKNRGSSGRLLWSSYVYKYLSRDFLIRLIIQQSFSSLRRTIDVPDNTRSPFP
jgi:hypothetical protein